jgi:hypothetical protein
MRRMADENRLWGDERIANELRLKVGLSAHDVCECPFMPDSECSCNVRAFA